MLATNQFTNTISTPLDDFDAFLENPLGYKLTIHQSNTIGNVIKELHKDSEGYIASCHLTDDNKMEQKFYKIDEFECETENAFFSLNTFYTKWRNTKCVYELTSFYCDIDYYKTGLNQQQILWLLENDIFGVLIPWPTWLVCSGNGLYYILQFQNKVKIRECFATKYGNKIDYKIKEKWDACMKFINDTLQDYGADKKAMDAARILRVDGTLNIKNGRETKVEIIKQYGNKIEDIDEFVELWLPESYIPQEKPCKTPKHLLKEEYTVKEIKTITNKKVSTKSLKKLNKERMGDIVRLVSMRNGECDGIRNYLLLLYSYHSLLVNGGNLEQTTEETFKLNNMFTHQERESQIRATLRTAYKAYQEWVTGDKVLYNGKWCRKGYNFTNQNLIDILSVTIDEQKKLKTIKSKEIVNEKRNAKKRAKRRNESGLTKREEKKQETIAKIMELKSQGLNNSEIARQLGISRQIVSKYVNQCFATK
jgi:DNA-binding CsgD family transcriptional regulator